jgi:predicted alpha-1,2-mannosidase
MKNISYTLLIVFSCLLAGSCTKGKLEPVDYVNPRIGNISHLLVPTYPTVHLPNSMVRFYPDRENFTSNTIKSFPLNIISHRSWNIFSLLPFSVEAERNGQDQPYTYDNEIITPYRYSVYLEGHEIDLRFAPAGKAGFFSLHFNKPGDHGFLIRTNGEGKIDCRDGKISGYEIFNGVKTYVFMETDRVPGKVTETPAARNNGSGLIISFKSPDAAELNIRYGLSYISTVQAEKNLRENIGGKSLEEVAARARDAWNETLSRIKIEGGSADQRTVFYTSLYRCSERMINVTEDGNYFSVWDNRTEAADDTDFYTDDWVWDTHLALHPLQVLLHPEEQAAKITSYIRMARQSGWMPTFPTPTGDMHAMNGNHSAAVVLDAWEKGIRGFDLKEAYEHLKNTILNETKLPWVRDSATWIDRFYDRKGYFPALRKGEAETCPKVHSWEKRQAVAVTLASSWDDWCMARIAKELGLKSDYDFFSARSLNYRNLFNPSTGFYHPKDSSGNWIEPLDYRFDGGMGARDYYDENNGWTYIWQPYHAFADLISMMGGREKFDEKLDRLFTEPLGRSKWQYYATMPDATGNVGQFVMGNEPSMHIAYLYNLAGKPWKTQKRVRMLMDTWFRNDLMGVPGDEDGGGLSAFYVFSAMGFYPLTPGIPEYQLGSPLFNKIKVRLSNGKIFTVLARDNSERNKYVISATLNGKLLEKPAISHEAVINGGTLVLEMGSKPGKTWGTF